MGYLMTRLICPVLFLVITCRLLYFHCVFLEVYAIILGTHDRDPTYQGWDGWTDMPCVYVSNFLWRGVTGTFKFPQRRSNNQDLMV